MAKKHSKKHTKKTIVVRISKDVFERLKKYAEPLESSVDDAIRRILVILEQVIDL